VADISQRRKAEDRLKSQVDWLDLLRRITQAIGERLDLHSIMQVVVASLEENLTIDFVCCCRQRVHPLQKLQ